MDGVKQTFQALTIGTDGISVPKGTRAVYMYVPVLNSGTHTPAYSLDGGTTWTPFAFEDLINQIAMPVTNNTGSARWGFQLPYASSTMKVRVISSVSQANKSNIVVVFAGV